MKTIGCFSRLSKQQPSPAITQRIAAGSAIVLFLMATGIAAAQLPAPDSKMAVPDGYKAHQTLDVGGNMVGLSGSGAMYDTLVNKQSGPRVLGETFEMHALPGNTHTLVDSLHAFGNGFGGDPINFAKLTFEKGKLYEFSGTFRRDRQYFDYDLLGNPNITTGQSIPIGPSATSTTSLAWPQVNHSSVMFNTVRRMTDTNLTLLPLSKVTFRVGYSQNIFQGPTLTPSYNIAKYNALLREFQRNSTDVFTGGVDWKPVRGTKLSFDEEITHYKADSYYTLDPNGFMVQESDGTPAYLGNWDSQTAYAIAACNKTSMVNNTTILYPNPNGGMPIIDPACDVVTSYTRTQPTRILTPTEIVRLQSSSIKNVTMNGDFRFTDAKMNLPNYYENFQGLDGAARSFTYAANGAAKREVVSGDYGFVWQATSKLSLADQIDYSNVHQPGSTTFTSMTTMNVPTTAGNETINYTGAQTTVNAANGANTISGASTVNTPLPADFGQRLFTNNLTGSWEATSTLQLSLTYRHRTHRINEGLNGADNAPLTPGATNNGDVVINEDGGIFNAAYHVMPNWSINGTVEALYDDNAFTPVGPRQTRHYRVHSLYRPKPWAAISGAYNDLERHNNTNNNQVTTALFVPATATTTASGTPYEGPLQHVDYSRVFSMSADLNPNEHYGLDLNYAYTHVYAATNICYLNGATATLPGAVQTATSTPCPNVFGRGASAATEVSGAALEDWFAKDFMDSPTQYLSAAVMLSPNDKVHSTIGYRISDVNGSRFFNDARDVNGSMVSKYQSPFVNFSWTIHPGLIFKTEYNYFGYGEGGASGSPYCSTTTSPTATVIPCDSATISAYPTGLTEPTSGLTAARTFHANNLTLAMHYEF